VSDRTQVAVIGAGIAGLSAAYHLTRAGATDVAIVDDRPPLSLTSDKSTECYRNWWPGPGDTMVSLMNRSIDLLEQIADETGNRINLNRRGYLFASADTSRIPQYLAAAEEAAALGAGPMRVHHGAADDPAYRPAPSAGYSGQPTGADVFLDAGLIHRHFPYLAEGTVAVVHARRCGWFSAQQLGSYFLEEARRAGARLIPARVEAIEVEGGRVAGLRLSGADRARISTDRIVLASGPHLAETGRMIGIDLPVFNELHGKVSFSDHLGVVPREAPLLIWNDPVRLPWSREEQGELAASDGSEYLLRPFPPGVHARPEGGDRSPVVLVLWTYHVEPVQPTFPPVFDPLHAEISLRGLSAMLPALRQYFGRMPKAVVDGGYYLKTKENRPLVGPLPVEGSYVLGALSGFGLMAAPACGELLAAHVAGGSLPSYAEALRLERYEDPRYRRLLENWGSSGQL
jgi:glycine/D-amino acid oxidase-like deaminating enzyme